MSRVHAGGKRGPGVVRAAVKISLGCVLLGGCSAGTERLTSLEFGSGYEAAPPRSSTSASTAAINAPQYHPVREAASSQSKPQSGYQLASASPDQSGGYLQVSRVDLPPAEQQSSGSSGVKTADGYGPYGPAPLSDGTYAGPRVYPRPTMSQTAAMRPLRRRRPEATLRLPVVIAHPPRAITVAARVTRRPLRIREAGLMAISSSRRTSGMAADMIARRRRTMRITGLIRGTPRPWTAGKRRGPPVLPLPMRRAERWSGLRRAKLFFLWPSGTA